MKVVWSPLACDQVVQAVASIAAERPPAALRWFEEVLHKAAALESFPDMGRMVPEVRQSSVREVLVAPYRLRVVYNATTSPTVVVTVFFDRRERRRREGHIR